MNISGPGSLSIQCGDYSLEPSEVVMKCGIYVNGALSILNGAKVQSLTGDITYSTSCTYTTWNCGIYCTGDVTLNDALVYTKSRKVTVADNESYSYGLYVKQKFTIVDSLIEAGFGRAHTDYTAIKIVSNDAVLNGATDNGISNPYILTNRALKYITFDACGGSWSNGNTSKNIEIGSDGTISQPENPTWGDYVFAGWTYSNGIEVDNFTQKFDNKTTIL